MTRALGFAVLLACAATGVRAQDAPTVSWCQIDDPAAWQAARRALIDSGAETLNAIPCPAPAPASELPEDLALPMPCGRQMMFRRIDVPVAHPLDQVTGNFGRVIELDAETPQSVLSNSPWIAPVSGAFSLTKAGRRATSDDLPDLATRSYYLAKYELTDPQWQAFASGLLDLAPDETADPRGPACRVYDAALNAGDLRQIPAKGNLSWYDAIAFSRAYNRWLLAGDSARLAAKAPPALPWEQGATGYVRLPSEAEWEYAARGGAAYVGAQNRGMRLYPVRDASGKIREPDLREICAEPPKAAPPRPGAVGTRLPNVLGLYDMLCNAEEIVLDLFRPTRPDGLAGQIGGVVTKGGSSLLLREQNGLGRRSEAAALFTLRGEGATPSMGMRLAISAPVFAGRDSAADPWREGLSNQPLEDRMIAGRAQLLTGGATLGSADSGKLLSEEVGRLRREIADRDMTREELARQTSELQVRMDRLSTELADRDREAALLSIRSGVVAGNLIDRVGRNIANAMDQLSQNEQAIPTQAKRREVVAKFLPQIAMNANRIDEAYDLYLQTQMALAARPESFVADRISEIRSQFEKAGQETLDGSVDLFERHQTALRAARGQLSDPMRQAWIHDLDVTRREREATYPQYQ